MTGVDEVVLERLRTEGDQPDPLFEEERRCAYPPCSKPLRRRDGEKLCAFKTRRFCGISCGARNSHPPAPQETKPCTVCGGPVRRRDKEGRGRWDARDACSTSCGAKLRRSRDAAEAVAGAAAGTGRVCAYPACGKPLIQRVGEPLSAFTPRRYCNRSCATSHQNAVRSGRAPLVSESKRCEGCPTVLERGGLADWAWRRKRFCTPGCASRSRRVGQKVVPSRSRKPKPARISHPVPVLPPVERPRPEDLIPDPAVVDMDRKHRAAVVMLCKGAAPERVAAEVGVSLALVRRWDRDAG